MGDNLIALRRIQERPPRWGRHRMRTFKGDPKENFDEFAEEITYSCKKMGFDSDEEDKVRYLRGFLEGEAAEFLASMPHKYTLKQILKKIRDRFEDSRTQSDFLNMLTTRRHKPKKETMREYSHALHNLVEICLTHNNEIRKEKTIGKIHETFSILENTKLSARMREIALTRTYPLHNAPDARCTPTLSWTT